MPPLNDRLRVLVISLVCLTVSSVIALLALAGSGRPGAVGESQQGSELDESFEQAAASRAVSPLATALETGQVSSVVPARSADTANTAVASTTIITAYASTTATSTTMLFVGDMFFDRHIRVAAAKKGGDYLFSCIDPLFKSVDMVVGNLEGPITTNASVSLGTKQDNPRHFQFTFPTSTAAVLARHNVRLVNLGNNHIANFGKSGIASTHSYLEKAGVAYFGGIAGDSPLYRMWSGDRLFSFINYNQFGGESAKVVATRIAQEKSIDATVIVYTHWGDEYAYGVASMQKAARLFAENGADVIIGSHPHVVLDSARIGQTLIYYSLGNFIFDQYFNARVKNGLAVALTFALGTSTPALVNVQEYPVVLKTDGRTCVVEEGK